MIALTINDRDITLDRPMFVLDAARSAGIKIPTLCNHELLKPYGGCRLCVVEVERMPKLQNACTLMAADGMVVRTESEEISQVRRGILEFLLINHPLDCPYCDKAGECELQDLVNKYGPTVGRYKEQKRKVPESHMDQIFTRNMERCVVCTRCVRMCHDIQGASAITVVGRGNRSRVEPFSAESFNCEYCGNCLTVCPVGAILSRLYMHSFRPWQVDREVETVCSYCGVGCSMVVQVREDEIKRVIPKIGMGVNNGLLCVRGRFGYEYVASRARIGTPKIRRNGELEDCSWSEAFSFVADRLTNIKKSYGGQAIGAVASGRCCNEDNYVLQKFMRMACRSNNIDSLSRTGFAAAQRFFEDQLGQGITANLIEGLKNSEAILVLGGDPCSINPVLGLSVREAYRRGAKVIVIGHAGGLHRFLSVNPAIPAFGESELLENLLVGIFNQRGVRGEKLDIDNRIRMLSESLSGESEGHGFEKMKKCLLESKSTSIVFGPDLVQRSDGHRVMFAVAGLTYLLEARLYLLSERPNEQGLVDAGCVPDLLPGCRPLGIHDFRMKYEHEWGGPLPGEEGMTLMEMFEGAVDGRIKALYVMGENPACNLPNVRGVERALKSLELLIVQDMFMTETAQLADVVLPAIGWTEKTGTYTNLERRIQLQKKAVQAKPGMEDWKIISEISTKMGYDMNYTSAEDIMDEIASVSPLYQDLTYREIAKGKCLWPYHGEPLRGETREIKPVSQEALKFNGDLYLALDRPLFHSGTLSRKSPALMRICPDATLKIGPSVATRLGLADGDMVEFGTDDKSIEASVVIDRSINDNKILFPNNFAGRGAYYLMKYRLDPVTKAPGTEGCIVTIKSIRKQEDSGRS